MAAPQIQRSVPEVLQDIVGNLQEIIRSEFRLAKVELKEETLKASKPVATFGMGLVFGFYGIGFLLLSLVYWLTTLMAVWLAALLIGAGLAIVAIALMSSSGKKLKRVNPTPDKTIPSLEENVLWMKHPIK
jgi:uncharacterized membrane protein YqjE